MIAAPLGGVCRVRYAPRSMADRPSLYLRLALPSAFLLALGWLIAQVGWPHAVARIAWGDGRWVLGLALLSAVALGARALASDDEDERRRRWDEALLAPCVLAPLAVIAPWVTLPAPLGVGLGDLPFFLAWLTRYPNNYEVVLGIGAMLGACAMPAFFAFYVAQARAPRAGLVLAFLMLQLLSYLPVLFALDAETALVALFVACNGLWLFPGGEGEPWFALSIAAGALLRGLATLAMLAFFVRALRRAAPRVVWEMAV